MPLSLLDGAFYGDRHSDKKRHQMAVLAFAGCAGTLHALQALHEELPDESGCGSDGRQGIDEELRMRSLRRVCGYLPE